MSDRLPIYETGLEEVIKACRGCNLFFNTNVYKHVGEYRARQRQQRPSKRWGITAPVLAAAHLFLGTHMSMHVVHATC